MNFFDKKLLSLIDSEDQKKLPWLITIVLFSGFIEIFGLGLLIPISQIILNENFITNNQLLQNLVSYSNLLSKDNLFEVLISIFFISYIIKILLLIYVNWYQNIFTINFNKKLSNYFYQKYLNKDYFSIQDLSSSEFIRNSILEIDKLTEFLVNNLRLIIEAISFIIIVLFLYYYNFFPSLAVSILVIIFSAVYYLALRSRISKIGLTRQKFENQKIRFLQSVFGGIKDIKMSFSEKYFLTKFKYFNSIIADALGKNALYNILPRYLLELVLIGILSGYLISVKIFEIDLNTVIAALPIYLVAFARLFPSVNKIISSLQGMRLNKPALDVVFKKITEYNKLHNPSTKEFKKINFSKSIILEIKKFKYTSSSSFEIKNLKIEIKKGEKVGIIGPSGSGKSTIVEILTNILHLKNGDVTLDGMSTKKFINSWRNLIGYIPQKIYILDDTLKNNICLNEKYKNLSDKYFIDILRQVGLLDWFKKLSKGLKTNLNERGLNLSGGEIQRLGIARALVHNPKILILDEATSSLDSFTEKEVLKNIFSLKDKTVISISHRLETLRNFDKIYLIKNGLLIKKIDYLKNK